MSSNTKTIHDRRWGILGVLILCLLVVILDNSILNVALKTIQETLGTSLSEMQWAVDSYALVFAGLLIPAGVLGDRWGRQRFLLVGMIIFGATSALCSFASTLGARPDTANRSRIQAPRCPGRKSEASLSSIRPPWSSSTRPTIASPSPVPLARVVT